MSLHGFENADHNHNQYPQIYAHAVSPTNPAPFDEQVNEFFAPLRARGLEPVNMAAYLEKCKFDYPRVAEQITERLKKAMRERIEETEEVVIVFVWDIGDMTMLCENHLAELSLLRPDINTSLISRLIEGTVASVGLDGSVPNIEDKSRKTDALRNLYNMVQPNGVKRKQSVFHEVIKRCKLVEQRDDLRQAFKNHQNVYNKRWKYTRRCLNLVKTRSAKSKKIKYVNVVLCDEGVAAGAIQLLIAHLSSAVPIENVYSTFGVTIRSVFERIQERFGGKGFLIQVTSGPRRFDVPFHFMWPIRANEAFKFLYKAQRAILHD